MKTKEKRLINTPYTLAKPQDNSKTTFLRRKCYFIKKDGSLGYINEFVKVVKIKDFPHLQGLYFGKKQ